MKNPFSIGAQKEYRHIVTPADFARFDTGEVHAVYATFSLARDAEWSGRLFVLEMKEETEEGIGTGITVVHHSPAVAGDEVVFTATLTAVNGNEVVTEYIAQVGNRIIATGEQKQKIVLKEKLNQLFEQLRQA